MKRLLVVVASVAALLTLSVGAATAKTGGGFDLHPYTLTVAIDPGTFVVGEATDVSVSGTVSWAYGPFAGHGVKNQVVKLGVYMGSTCGEGSFIHSLDSQKTDHHGFYEYTTPEPITFAANEVGTYHIQATAFGAEPVCATFTVGPVATTVVQPAGQVSVFLCYSKWQVEPGVWSYDMAHDLFTNDGYWLPFAVAGNVPFGTNIGGYHLVCNVAATQSVSSSLLGAGVSVYAGGETGGVFGPFYPVAGG